MRLSLAILIALLAGCMSVAPRSVARDAGMACEGDADCVGTCEPLGLEWKEPQTSHAFGLEIASSRRRLLTPAGAIVLGACSESMIKRECGLFVNQNALVIGGPCEELRRNES